MEILAWIFGAALAVFALLFIVACLGAIILVIRAVWESLS